MSVIVMCKNFLYNEVFINNSKIYIPNNTDSLFLIVNYTAHKQNASICL